MRRKIGIIVIAVFFLVTGTIFVLSGNSPIPINKNIVTEDTTKTEEKNPKNLILFYGIELPYDKPDIYNLNEELPKDANLKQLESKYNKEYYNYSFGEYKGKYNGKYSVAPGSEGTDIASVQSVGRVAMTSGHNALPRTFKKCDIVPELIDSSLREALPSEVDFTGGAITTEAEKIDLDGDESDEYLASIVATVQNEIGEVWEYSEISIYNNEFKKVSRLTYAMYNKDVYYPKTQKLYNVECVDLNKDGILEVIIHVCSYDKFLEINVLNYNRGMIVGKPEYSADKGNKI